MNSLGTSTNGGRQGGDKVLIFEWCKNANIKFSPGFSNQAGVLWCSTAGKPQTTKLLMILSFSLKRWLVFTDKKIDIKQSNQLALQSFGKTSRGTINCSFCLQWVF